LLFLTKYSCFDKTEIIQLLTEDNYNCEDNVPFLRWKNSLFQ